MEMISAEKVRLSETYIDAQNTYVDFYDEFVKTFNLNMIQCCALRRLCDHAEAYALATADRLKAGIDADEARSTYESMMAECWGADWRNAG